MVPPTVTSTAWTGSIARETPERLEERYRAYCQAQAAALPALLPRAAVRSVYRDAREAAGDGAVDDPLALLTTWCARVLPLPPFEVWLEDYRRHPGAYREALGEPPPEPSRAEPVTVDLRTLELGGRTWYAGLDVFRADGDWRGVIAFHTGDGRAQHRTGEVFRGDAPWELRERFVSFDGATLAAFLRSVLP